MKHACTPPIGRLDGRETTKLKPDSIELYRKEFPLEQLLDAETWQAASPEQRIRIEVNFKKFRRDRHVVTLIAGCTSAFLIDGKEIKGEDGMVPKETMCEVARLAVTRSGSHMVVPPVAYGDCYYAFNDDARNIQSLRASPDDQPG